MKAVHPINPAVHPVRVERANWKGAKWRSVSLHLHRRSATDATCYVACYNYLDPFALPKLLGIALYVVRIRNESSRCINVDEKEPSYVRSIVAFSLERTYPADMPVYREEREPDRSPSRTDIHNGAPFLILDYEKCPRITELRMAV